MKLRREGRGSVNQTKVSTQETRSGQVNDVLGDRHNETGPLFSMGIQPGYSLPVSRSPVIPSLNDEILQFIEINTRVKYFECKLG